MGGRKRQRKQTIKYSNKTSRTSTNSDCDNNELPGTSQPSRNSRNTSPSWVDLNYEQLKINPFLIPNVLDCLCANSSPHALFKYRLVSHIWNELSVNHINQVHPGSVRLLKVADQKIISLNDKDPSDPGVVNVKELISSLNEGKLKKSTLTRIYLDSFLKLHDLNTFLQLNGENIQTLHYDGDSLDLQLEQLRKILQTCARNLKNLSLWDIGDDIEKLFKGEGDTNQIFKLPRLHSLSIVSREVNLIHMGRVEYYSRMNVCNPSKEFLTDLFQASPNLKSLSARFFESFIWESGFSFKNLTTLCIKFKIQNEQLRALCHVGLKLKKLRLQGLFVPSKKRFEEEDEYQYGGDPEWIEFRGILLKFIQTQANTLEYFAVYLFYEIADFRPRNHDSPHEQWSSTTGFPTMPHLRTFILNECSAQIRKEEFGHLFPKLRNLEIVGCHLIHQRIPGPPPQPNILVNPLHDLISSISVRNIRGLKPTMRLAQLFPSVIELHIENEIPYGLSIRWPKLKHLYYRECKKDNQTHVMAYVRRMNEFLVGISPEESERIEELGERLRFDQLANLNLPRSRPSIFDLNELETFKFEFISFEFKQRFNTPGIESALGVLITLGLSRLTHLKKLNFTLEQKPRPNRYYGLPGPSLDGLAKTFGNREDLNVASKCNESGWNPNEPRTKKWTLKLNLDHHKSEWKEIDQLFHDDPDICDLGDFGSPTSVMDNEDEEDDDNDNGNH